MTKRVTKDPNFLIESPLVHHEGVEFFDSEFEGNVKVEQIADKIYLYSRVESDEIKVFNSHELSAIEAIDIGTYLIQAAGNVNK